MEKIRKFTVITALFAGIILFASACNDTLDIQQSYEFSVTTMPVQKRIKKGETAEIRCQLNRSGRYDEARYFLSYFQPDGKGSLIDDTKRIFIPNDLYPLDKETFRLYYTSQCEDQQTIDITFYDDNGQRFELSFTFNNDNS